MGWFTPKLEPGETLVGQLPAKPTIRRLLPGAVLAVATGAVFCALPFWLGAADRAWVVLPIGVGVGFMVLGNFWKGHAWSVALTDRRLLIRRAALWRAPVEISRGEIDSVAMDSAAYRIMIRGGGQEIGIDPMRVEFDELKRLLGRASETAL